MKNSPAVFFVLILVVIAKYNLSFTKKELVFEEVNGVVAVEAEHFTKQKKTSKRKWYLQSTSTSADVQPDKDGNHAADACGSAYMEILPDTRITHDDSLVHGVNFTNSPGTMAVLDYKVYFNTTGKYYVWVRTHTSGSEDNGVHVGIDGKWPETGQRMQFWGNSPKWQWQSRQRTGEVHTGVEKLIYLNIDKPGLHTISFSMREDGFEFDKWVMEKEFIKPEGEGPEEKRKK